MGKGLVAMRHGAVAGVVPARAGIAQARPIMRWADVLLLVRPELHSTPDGDTARARMVAPADDVTVRGVRFAHVGTAFTEDRAALRVKDERNCTIVDDRLDDTFFGIFFF